MATQTYNTGRVVGWSAYEEFLKEHPDIDPSTLSEQMFITATTYGVTKSMRLSVDAADWTGTDILMQTVAVPGAVWGVVPIVGIDYDAAHATVDHDTAVLMKEQTEDAMAHIFTCYCSDASGNRVSNASSASGYITFCAHPELKETQLSTIHIIIRGLGVEALTDGGYFGPAGMVFAGNALSGVDHDPGLKVVGYTTEPIQLISSESPYYAFRNAATIEDADGTQHTYTSLSLSGPDGGRYSLKGEDGDDRIILHGTETNPNTHEMTYSGHFNWEDLAWMLTDNRQALIEFTYTPPQPEPYVRDKPTYIDISRLFGFKKWSANNNNFVTSDGLVAFNLRLGDARATRVLAPWDGSTAIGNATYDGFYRVLLKLYPSEYSLTSKFEMVIAAYLKSDVTLTTSESNPFKSVGFYWRGKLSSTARDQVDARYPALGNDTLTLIPDTVGEVSPIFQPSTAMTTLWDTVPESQSAVWGNLSFLMGKSMTLDSHPQAWGLNLTIKGVAWAGTNNDALYSIDTSCSSGSTDANTGLTTDIGGTTSDTTATWHAVTSMETSIANVDEAHASFYNKCSGIYITE